MHILCVCVRLCVCVCARVRVRAHTHREKNTKALLFISFTLTNQYDTLTESHWQRASSLARLTTST